MKSARGRKITQVFTAVAGAVRYRIVEESGHKAGEVKYYTTDGLPVHKIDAFIFEILVPDGHTGAVKVLAQRVDPAGEGAPGKGETLPT